MKQKASAKTKLLLKQRFAKILFIIISVSMQLMFDQLQEWLMIPLKRKQIAK